MKYKNFPQNFWLSVEQKLDQLQKPLFAAFDADGTLWDTDLGESFFQWQIKNKVLKGLPADPWRHYRDWKESGDPRPAYLWLAQINQGHTLEEVRSWAQKCVEDMAPLPIFEEQRKLIELLHKYGVQVYVVTASVKWSVEPGAKLLGIPHDRVLGVATAVRNGVISDQQEGEITWREGKAKALLQKTKGLAPLLSSGNTTGDTALLECASHFRLVVGAAPQGHELFSTEEKLRQLGQDQGWFVHKFI